MRALPYVDAFLCFSLHEIYVMSPENLCTFYDGRACSFRYHCSKGSGFPI